VRRRANENAAASSIAIFRPLHAVRPTRTFAQHGRAAPIATPEIKPKDLQTAPKAKLSLDGRDDGFVLM